MTDFGLHAPARVTLDRTIFIEKKTNCDRLHTPQTIHGELKPHEIIFYIAYEVIETQCQDEMFSVRD